MSLLRNIWSIVIVAFRRLIAQRWLALATIVGLVTSVALIISIPMYADAIYYRILQKELSTQYQKDRSPFAYMFRYVGAWDGPLQWEDTRQANEFFMTQGGSDLGLPQKTLVRYFTTDNFEIYPKDEVVYSAITDPLIYSRFVTVSGIEDRIQIVEGDFPAPAENINDSVVEVLISEKVAEGVGFQVGEEYTAFAKRLIDGTQRIYQIPFRISGIWKPIDPQDEGWFYEPELLEDALIIPEASYVNRLSPYMEDEIYTAIWYLVMDGSNVHSNQVGSLLGRTVRMQQKVAALLPKLKLIISPQEALASYWRAARVLTFLLFAYSIPIIGLVLAFIALVGGLLAQQQQNEVAVLRSRGASALQIILIAALEGVILGVLALIIAIPVGQLITQLIGKTRSFLDFSLISDLRWGVSRDVVQVGLIAVGISLLAILIPTIGASRHTIVTYKQERARTLRAPWWQRAYMDIFLLIPAVYGMYQLRKQGSILAPGSDLVSSADPFQNPLLFLVPALGVLALTLFLLRFFPWFMAALAWISGRTRSVGFLLAARHLARSPGFYSAPVVLLVLTLSLSAFTASLASTLDKHLHDSTFYQAGSEMSLVEPGEDLSVGAGFNPGGGGEAESEAPAETSELDEGTPRWLILPVKEHLLVPGIEAVMRMGRFAGFTQLSGRSQAVVYMGIDRVEFPKVAFWRRDFSDENLGTLMNALALEDEGVLVESSFLRQHGLKVGDVMRVNVRTPLEAIDVDFKVVGSFDLFPSWMPEEGPLIVGNLDFLFESLGWEIPYDVWVKTAEKVTDYERIIEDIEAQGNMVMSSDIAPQKIVGEQTRPERQGLFGILSVGFIASAFLTILGFLLYALFSFRRRFIELGILRATGLTAKQMSVFLAWELAFLILAGGVVGTLLGGLVSQLFIPYLQIGGDVASVVPPFVVEIAWSAIFRIYILFALVFLVALAGLAVLLTRMKIFQAIKLGETA